MDGYEYEAKVLWPKWNKEAMGEVEEDNNNKVLESKNAGFINEEEEETRKRFKDVLGIDLKRVPTDGELSNGIFRNPDNFVPELSPNNEVWDLGRRFRDQRR